MNGASLTHLADKKGLRRSVNIIYFDTNHAL
jgi:hypothetical protein